MNAMVRTTASRSNYPAWHFFSFWAGLVCGLALSGIAFFHPSLKVQAGVFVVSAPICFWGFRRRITEEFYILCGYIAVEFENYSPPHPAITGLAWGTLPVLGAGVIHLTLCWLDFSSL